MFFPVVTCAFAFGAAFAFGLVFLLWLGLVLLDVVFLVLAALALDLILFTRRALLALLFLPIRFHPC